MCAAAQHVAAPRSVPRLAAQPRKSAEIALNYLDAVARLRNRLHAKAVGDQQRKGTRTLKRPQRANIAQRANMAQRAEIATGAPLEEAPVNSWMDGWME